MAREDELLEHIKKTSQAATTNVALSIKTHNQLTLVPDVITPLSFDKILLRSVLIKSMGSNTSFIYIGTELLTTSNGYILEPSEVLGIDVKDPSQIYLLSSETATISWLGLGT